VLEGKVGREAGKCGDDVVFYGLDGAFSFVATMSVGRDVLDREGEKAESTLKTGGGFVVGAYPVRVKTSSAKNADGGMVGSSIFGASTGLEADDLDNVLVD
jgi:hypothetical protein